jgi:hypothetical protein
VLLFLIAAVVCLPFHTCERTDRIHPSESWSVLLLLLLLCSKLHGRYAACSGCIHKKYLSMDALHMPQRRACTQPQKLTAQQTDA